MAKTALYNMEGAAIGEIELSDAIFASDVNVAAMHLVVRSYLAAQRQGTQSAKTRTEVRGGGRKIYRQKGTGNARHGDKRAPIFVGGGVVFGPRPCDYSKKVNKSTRRLALRRVLGDLIAASKVSTVSEFSVADGKTKSFIKAVKDLTDAKKVLIVAASFDETTYRAARNVQEVLLMTAAEVNIEQLMNADAVILVDNALETLASRTA